MTANKLDLRSGQSPWITSTLDDGPTHHLHSSMRCRILIVGAGITGSFLAERLSRVTRSIVIVDRHVPHTASTAASTSLVQWDLDAPFSELSERLGVSVAAQIYRTSFTAVTDIIERANALGINCHCAMRPSLYIAGNRLDPKQLHIEARQRQDAGLPSHFLTAKALHEGFCFDAAAGLHSEGAAEADPVLLARGLMQHARSRGAQSFYPETAVAYDIGHATATILTAGGREVCGDFLVLANGYEMPDFVPAKVHSIVSTWALATTRQTRRWPKRALVWEASSPYLYARQTSDGRVIIGGEDEELTDPHIRDSKIPEKSAILKRKFTTLYPSFAGETEFSWAGFFGTTRDGLPLIGRLPAHPRVFAAFGYGGNGISFSAIAAEMITSAIFDPKYRFPDYFAVDRD
jgi:glycine/D-amino acid oxidase-like deaminating enzyme